jgi:hypothetical protein
MDIFLVQKSRNHFMTPCLQVTTNCSEKDHYFAIFAAIETNTRTSKNRIWALRLLLLTAATEEIHSQDLCKFRRQKEQNLSMTCNPTIAVTATKCCRRSFFTTIFNRRDVLGGCRTSRRTEHPIEKGSPLFTFH